MSNSETSTTVQCGLCPKGCLIAPGQSGNCRIRVNIDGQLCAVTYGYPCALHLDPVEKKPLFHFLPGTKILSLATVGCNLHCKQCQNWQISQCNPEDSRAKQCPPAKVPRLARRSKVRSIAYTYTEPCVFYEYTLASAQKAKANGFYNVLVTAGYINNAPWKELCRHVHAANIDLKSCRNAFYRDVCGASLRPVLESLVTAKSMGLVTEVTNLVIPTLNDSEEDLRTMCSWIRRHLGPETPLHFSQFFPSYKLKHLPPTPKKTLKQARRIGQAEGLQHIYVGNVTMEDAQHTTCPKCGTILIERKRYSILSNNLEDGQCPKCGKEIYGKWS